MEVGIRWRMCLFLLRQHECGKEREVDEGSTGNTSKEEMIRHKVHSCADICQKVLDNWMKRTSPSPCQTARRSSLRSRQLDLVSDCWTLLMVILNALDFVIIPARPAGLVAVATIIVHSSPAKPSPASPPGKHSSAIRVFTTSIFGLQQIHQLINSMN